MLVAGPSMLTLDQAPGIWLLHNSTLPMFFALSGFLIAGSAQRLTVSQFIINRSLRIYPALAVEILLSALILGPVFTSLSLHQYCLQKETYKYLFNLIGYIQFHLPGMFLKNPFDIVNGSLWTVPVEIACYIIMVLLIVTKTLTKPGWIAAAATAYPLIWFLYMATLYNSHRTGVTAYVLNLFFNFTGFQLIPCFLLAVAMYIARYRIPHSPILFIGAIVMLCVIGVLANAKLQYDPALNIISNPLFVYIVIYVGLSKTPKLPFYSTGDYSYGLYLYAYPIQQSIKQLLPNIAVPVHLAVSITIVTVFAAFSWHCIEKPILAMRRNFAFVSRRRQAAV